MSPKLLIAAAVLSAGFVGQAEARAPRADRFPLGQSAQSGAVCEAVRDDADVAAQTRGARAWAVRCRGWDTPLGRLYAYEYKGDEALNGLYQKTLADRAQCQPGKAQTLVGVSGVSRSACELSSAKVSYVSYRGARGKTAVAAEGFAQIADVLEAGLKIAAGAESPPKDVTRRVAAASNVAQEFGGSLGSLAAAADAAATAPENLRERAYSRNTEWRFNAAENDFRALAQNPRSASRARAEAYLNWALNASNVRRFSAADALFAEAERMTRTAQDPSLEARALSYRALHLRNQRKFTEALEAAEQARVKLLALAKSSNASDGAVAVVAEEAGRVAIGPDLAAALNQRAAAGLLRTNRLDEGSRIRMQVAQTLHTAATAKAALGDDAGARSSLDQAAALLSEPDLAKSSAWLAAQVESELARLDLNAKRYPQARARIEQALFTLRAHQGGTPAEAYMLVELARAEAAEGDRASAMRHFREGFDLFKETRGSLGASADAASVYFDLLLEDSKQQARRAQNTDLFFTAAANVGSEGTADTVARLAARLSQGDTVSAGLARALEDTRRQIQLKTSAIGAIQGSNDEALAAKAGLEAEIKSLATQAQELEQQLVAANPRYGQLVTSEASLAQLQAKLRPGELYLKTVLLGGRGYGVAVTRDEATPYAIELNEAEAARRVAALRVPFVTEGRLPSYDVAGSYALFNALFGPVKEKVLAATHIIYEPDESTLSLPIAALATDDASVALVQQRRAAIRAAGEGILSYDGVSWLGGRADTSLVVSAASFLQSRDFAPSKAARNFIGFGGALQPARSNAKAFNGVLAWGRTGEADVDLCRATRDALLGLRPLAEAGQEIRTVAQALGEGDDVLVRGAGFTDVGVRDRNDLKNYRVLYFATHGLLPRPGDCLPEPALVTSVGDGDSDALLDTSEILAMDLDADLVVLSACDTGGAAGSDATGLGGGGEALGGLTRAFIYAGARGLVVSHWQVDSAATMKLMTGMFQSGAPTQAAALRRSAQILMASPDQYSHPYYWAAFTVVGDGARAMPTRTTPALQQASR
jgi:CHAT domain-containing protein